MIFFRDYLDFIRNNRLSVFISILVLLFVFGIRLADNSIGIDTVNALDQLDVTKHIGDGRFGITLISKIFGITQYNLYVSNFISILCLELTAITWCFILNHNSTNNVSRIANLIFMSAYIASGVWVEILYFALSSAELTIVTLFCPICVYLVYRYILIGRKKSAILACILIVLFFATYQGTLILFGAGLLAVYIVMETNREEKVVKIPVLFRRTVLVCVLSCAAYFIINISIKSIMSLSTDYAASFIQIDRILNKGIKEWFLYIYTYFFGNVGFMARVVDPFIASHAGTGQSAVNYYHNSFYGVSNVIYFPIMILFALIIIRTKDILKIAASALLILTMFIFPLLGGGHCPMRSQFAIPFVSAVILWYTLTYYEWKNKNILMVVYAVILFFVFRQAQNNSWINVSDQRRYEAEVALAHEIDQDIKELGFVTEQNEEQQLLFIGEYSTDIIHTHKSEEGGTSIFSKPYSAVSFMRDLGLKYKRIEGVNIDVLTDEAKSMPSYPQRGYIKKIDDVIIVKMSEER